MALKNPILLFLLIIYVSATIMYFPMDLETASGWVINGHVIVIFISLIWVLNIEDSLSKNKPSKISKSNTNTQIILLIFLLLSSLIWTSYIMGFAAARRQSVKELSSTSINREV